MLLYSLVCTTFFQLSLNSIDLVCGKQAPKTKSNGQRSTVGERPYDRRRNTYIVGTSTSKLGSVHLESVYDLTIKCKVI